MSVAGKAATEFNFPKAIRINRKSTQLLHALLRKADRAYPGVTSRPIGTAIPGGEQSEGHVKTAGDTMIGPLAFYPIVASINTGQLDISRESGAFSSEGNFECIVWY